jgi:uncharacterized protein involved in exopolysaccharide biosynthesis
MRAAFLRILWPKLQPHMKRAILIPPLIALLTGFLVSFLFTPRYTSQATLLLKLPNAPAGAVLLSTDMIEHFESLVQAALSPTRMRPAVRSLNLVKPEQQEDQAIEDIRAHATETPQNAPDDLTPTFYIRCSDYNPLRAQQICQMLTELIVDESLRLRDSRSSGTYDFLVRQIDETKARVATIERELTKYRKKGKHRSAEEESRYRSLLRDYEQTKEAYTELLRKRKQADISFRLESQQDGEEVHVLVPASLPQAPDFPNRILFAAAGFAVGLALAVTLALLRRSTPVP